MTYDAAYMPGTEPEPARPKKLVRGHKRIIAPLGPVRPRRIVEEGWQSSCICGWPGETVRTSTEAGESYSRHLRSIAERRATEGGSCKRCGKPVPPEHLANGGAYLCTKCRNAATKAWALAHPEEMERHKRASYLRRKWGLTIEEAEALVRAQDGKCAICGETTPDSRGFRLHVDHKHGTNIVRGVLCIRCNNGLGCFRDRPDLLVAAAAYLDRTESKLPQQVLEQLAVAS